MLISEVISMLEKTKASIGDVAVYVDIGDCFERPVEENNDVLCKSPEYRDATKYLPARIII